MSPGLFKDRLDEIGAQGEVAVQLAGRPFHISRAFRRRSGGQRLTDPHSPACARRCSFFTSPTDDIVGIDNASRIFLAAKHPRASCRSPARTIS